MNKYWELLMLKNKSTLVPLVFLSPVFPVLVALLLHGTTICAAGLNCSKARTKAEILICSNRETRLLDESLGDLFYYRMHRSQASASEKQHLHVDQKIWLRTVRGACKDIPCLNQAYSERISALVPKNPAQDWQTDGHWYLYSRSNPAGLARHPVLAHVSKDASDALLTQFRGVGYWLTKQRGAIHSEMAEPLELFHPWSPLCGNASVSIEDQGNAHFYDALRAKVVIRNAQGQVLNSFALFRELKPTKEMASVPEDMSHSGRLQLPLTSAIYSVAALADCTFLAKIDEGVIRFTVEGTTRATLPVGTRLISGDEIQRLDDEFAAVHPTQPGVAIEQAKLWFFHSKLFSGAGK